MPVRNQLSISKNLQVFRAWASIHSLLWMGSYNPHKLSIFPYIPDPEHRSVLPPQKVWAVLGECSMPTWPQYIKCPPPDQDGWAQNALWGWAVAHNTKKPCSRSVVCPCLTKLQSPGSPPWAGEKQHSHPSLHLLQEFAVWKPLCLLAISCWLEDSQEGKHL